MGGSSSDNKWEFASFATGVRNLVLVGRTGNGKSATGNSIIGKKEFKSRASSAGVTSTCELKTTVLNDGQILNVIDTPGLFDSSAKSEFIGKEIVKCINMVKDIHAVLIVLSVRTRFSEEEEKALRILQNLFGKKIIDYMIVIFTGGDGLEADDETLEDYLGRDCPEFLKEILHLCENRRVLFNNTTKDEAKKAEQRCQLLSLVNKVMAKNRAQPFTDKLFAEILSQQMHESYEEQLKRSTEMVVLKLNEAILRLERQFAEEQVARLKAEQSAQKAQEKSNVEIRELKESLGRAHREMSAQKAQEKSNDENEIRKLRESLGRAQRETDELRNKQAESSRCIIL